jgi:cysteine desulfurase
MKVDDMSHAKELFLDHASTTPLHPDALGVMLPFFGNHFGTPSSLSDLGLKARLALDEARSRVAQLVNAKPHEIIFTSGGTESNNLALLGAAYAKGSRGRHIITSQVEHPSVLGVCRHLEREGFRVTYVPVDGQGRVDPASIKNAVSDDTLMISVMHANHVTGTIQPIAEIGAIARGRGITFHTDAVQSIGKIPIDMEELPVDLMSISSHKLFGPKGIGALYIRESAEIVPVIFGSEQERGIRPGTPNMPGIVGFGMACSIAAQDLESNSMLVTSLRESFEQQASNRIKGIEIPGSGASRLPHIVNFAIEGVAGESLAAHLETMGIIVSSGSSLYHSEDFSYVLEAMHVGRARIGNAIRLSLGWENKEKEIRHTVDCLDKAVTHIRNFFQASKGRDLSICTFPAKGNAVSAAEALESGKTPFTLIDKPQDIMHTSCSSIALACMADDQEKIGSLLGEHGIEISAMHRMRPRSKVMEKKEKEFWKKVELIKKGRK